MSYSKIPAGADLPHLRYQIPANGMPIKLRDRW